MHNRASSRDRVRPRAMHPVELVQSVFAPLLCFGGNQMVGEFQLSQFKASRHQRIFDRQSRRQTERESTAVRLHRYRNNNGDTQIRRDVEEPASPIRPPLSGPTQNLHHTRSGQGLKEHRLCGPTTPPPQGQSVAFNNLQQRGTTCGSTCSTGTAAKPRRVARREVPALRRPPPAIVHWERDLGVAVEQPGPLPVVTWRRRYGAIRQFQEMLSCRSLQAGQSLGRSVNPRAVTDMLRQVFDRFADAAPERIQGCDTDAGRAPNQAPRSAELIWVYLSTKEVQSGHVR